MRQYQKFLAAVAALACSSFLFRRRSVSMEDEDVFPLIPNRSLMAEQHVHPDAAGTSPANKTISIYLTRGSLRHNEHNPAYSIFETDVLRRFGTGRFDFHIRNLTPCDPTCKPIEADAGGPCLAAGHWKSCPLSKLKCNYPTCKTMVTNDESCKVSGYDVRGYYSSMANAKAKGYLPLGSRLDAWQSFQKIQASPDFAYVPASKRKYAFNAVFSEDTNQGRKNLAEHIDARGAESDLKTFAKIARKWTPSVNSPLSEQLDTDSYVEVVLDSVFTLAPAGHNPECFRMFEAVEAGSIPIFSKNDLYVKKKGDFNRRAWRCRDALRHWYDAPIVVLHNWNDLYPTVEKLMEEPEKLDEMQVKLREWYEGYMRKVVREFEDVLVDAPAEGATVAVAES
ncbi:hypothetical protein ACHAWF_006247 [Thalassiosira exigua]